MKNPKRLSGMLYFLAGVAVAVAVMFGFWCGQDARAGQYSCIRTDLDAQDMTGNFPDPEFTITYNVPSCYAMQGYKVERVYMYGSQVAVHYKKN